MKFIKTLVLSLFLISAFTLSNQLQATENGRYEIVQAGEYTFLLDKETGSTWKYFFNDISSQGWKDSYFYLMVEANGGVVSLTPYGKSFSIKE